MDKPLQNTMKNNKKTRNAGLELLRCVSMMMVVVLHYLGKGGLLPDMVKPESWTAVGITAWGIEAVCIVAVNVYMLISGYLLCQSHFKLSRLLSLYIQLWMYSVGVGAVAVVTGILPREELDIYTLLRLGLPVSMNHYWFMTAYVFFYLLLPLLGMAVKKMTKKQHRTVLILLLIAHSLIKSVLPFELETDNQGYDFMWYIVMFLLAAYIRLYNPRFMKKKWAAVMFAVGVGGSFAELMAIGMVGRMTGMLEHVAGVSMHYNHIFPILGALGLFGLLVKNDDAQGSSETGHMRPMRKCVLAIAPYTLGVYLLHENLSVRYVWPKWLFSDAATSVPTLVGYTLLAMVTVFAAGIIVEFIRSKLVMLIDKLLMHIKPYSKLKELIGKVDSVFVNSVFSDSASAEKA